MSSVALTASSGRTRLCQSASFSAIRSFARRYPTGLPVCSSTTGQREKCCSPSCRRTCSRLADRGRRLTRGQGTMMLRIAWARRPVHVFQGSAEVRMARTAFSMLLTPRAPGVGEHKPGESATSEPRLRRRWPRPAPTELQIAPARAGSGRARRDLQIGIQVSRHVATMAARSVACGNVQHEMRSMSDAGPFQDRPRAENVAKNGGSASAADFGDGVHVQIDDDGVQARVAQGDRSTVCPTGPGNRRRRPGVPSSPEAASASCH